MPYYSPWFYRQGGRASIPGCPSPLPPPCLLETCALAPAEGALAPVEDVHAPLEGLPFIVDFAGDEGGSPLGLRRLLFLFPPIIQALTVSGLEPAKYQPTFATSSVLHRSAHAAWSTLGSSVQAAPAPSTSVAKEGLTARMLGQTKPTASVVLGSAVPSSVPPGLSSGGMLSPVVGPPSPIASTVGLSAVESPALNAAAAAWSPPAALVIASPGAAMAVTPPSEELVKPRLSFAQALKKAIDSPDRGSQSQLLHEAPPRAAPSWSSPVDAVGIPIVDGSVQLPILLTPLSIPGVEQAGTF